MAIDTAAKRFSIAPLVPGGPRPEFSFDGTEDAGDRYSIMGLYDLTDGGGAPAPSSTFQKYQTVSIGKMMGNG